MEKTKNRRPAKPADVPPEFRAVMEQRKQDFGISFQFTLRQALAFALDNRAKWDPFFSK